MEEILALAKQVAEEAEVYMVSSEETPVNFESNRLKHIQYNTPTYGLRIVVNTIQPIPDFNMDTLQEISKSLQLDTKGLAFYPEYSGTKLLFLNNEKVKAEEALSQRISKKTEFEQSLAEYDLKYGQASNYLEDSQITFDEINRKIEESIKGWNSLKNPIFEREMEISSKRHSIAEIDLSLKYAKETLSKDVAFLENLKGLKEDIEILERDFFSQEGVSQELKQRLLQRKDSIYQKIDVEIELIQKNIDRQNSEVINVEKRKSEASEQLNTVETNKNEMSSHYFELEKKLNELTQEKEKSIARLAETRTQHSNYEITFKQKKQELETFLKEVRSAEIAIDSRRKEAEQISQRVESTINENSRLESNIPSLEGQESQLSEDILVIQAAKQDFQGKIQVLESVIKTQTELLIKVKEVAMITERMSNTVDETKGLESILPSLLEKENKLESDIQTISEKKAVDQNKLEVLEEKIRLMSNEDKNIRDALSKEEINLAKIEGEMGAVEVLMKQEYEMNIDEILAILLGAGAQLPGERTFVRHLDGKADDDAGVVERAVGIDQLRAEERARQRRDVNQHEPRIMPRQPRPEHDAHENSRKHQPAVGGGLQQGKFQIIFPVMSNVLKAARM